MKKVNMTVKPSVRKTKVDITVRPRKTTPPVTGVYAKAKGKKSC